MTRLEEWKNDFKGFINELSMPRDDYNGIIEYIDEAPNEPRWIPVSERLPDENEREKTYDRVEYASEFIVMIEGMTIPTTLYLTRDNHWKDDGGYFYSVVAWMPLPEPYREEQGHDD